jgi:polysaccharide biosynthesis/export protein
MQNRIKAIIKFSYLLPVLFVLMPACSQAGSRNDRQKEMGSIKGSQAEPLGASTNAPHNGTYIIGDDDVLAINVWNQKDISRSVPVRSDGKISLPLVGEIQAAGRTPFQLEEDITARLRNYITAPTVAVMVEKINSKKFNILGEVVRPGSYSTALATTVVDAIALAGGFRDFAKKKDIYILRQAPDGKQARIRFNYMNFIKGKNLAQNINLEPHDTIIVP